MHALVLAEYLKINELMGGRNCGVCWIIYMGVVREKEMPKYKCCLCIKKMF